MIAPVVRRVTVPVAPDRAFALFAGRIGAWWPKGKHIGANPAVDVVLEPGVGGRWFERDAEGVATQWGRVLAWEPPTQHAGGRLLLAWQITADWTFDPEFETEVEVRFAAADGGTEVRLEHRCLERYGAAAERMAGMLGGGWPLMLDCYRNTVVGGEQ
jgi:hypothetical protein